jgi:hypothetical protein
MTSFGNGMLSQYKTAIFISLAIFLVVLACACVG